MKRDKLKDFIEPFKTEFRFRDILQIIIGAALLSVPVGFTQETWDLGQTLPLTNIIWLLIMTLIFIGIFTYYHYHRHLIEKNPYHHLKHFTIRVFMTYAISFIIVTILLGTINVVPWTTDPILAFKRTVIVTLPSSMSAAIADVLK